MRYTPDDITVLDKDEIFVFGSNLSGIHGAGAAKLAYDKFGAKWGVGIGLAGQTYAIPTKDRDIQTLPLDKINHWVESFLMYASLRQEKIFLVTKIGCGLARYKVEDIAPMFKGHSSNVILPFDFAKLH